MNPLITEIDSFPSNTSQNDILKWFRKKINIRDVYLNFPKFVLALDTFLLFSDTIKSCMQRSGSILLLSDMKK